MFRFAFAILIVLCSGLARADGYHAVGKCFATIEEAVTYSAFYWNGSGQCATGQCRILTYVPTSGSTQVISNNGVLTLSIVACTGAISTLPSYMQSTPWFGSDPGVVSACGNTVSPTGGLTTGSTGSTAVVSLTPEQALERYNDGINLGWGVVVSILAVWGLSMIAKAFWL